MKRKILVMLLLIVLTSCGICGCCPKGEHKRLKSEITQRHGGSSVNIDVTVNGLRA